jgi:hypothetical protein
VPEATCATATPLSIATPAIATPFAQTHATEAATGIETRFAARVMARLRSEAVIGREGCAARSSSRAPGGASPRSFHRAGTRDALIVHLHARQRSPKRSSCGVQPRVHGAHGGTDDLGNGVARQLVDLEHHEHGTLVEIERVEQSCEPLACLASLREILGAVTGLDGVLDLGDGALTAHVRPPPVGGSDPHRDAEQPRRHLRARVEGRELAVNDHEDLLKHVLEIGIADTEPLQGRPDEVGVLSMHARHVECRRRDACGCDLRGGNQLGHDASICSRRLATINEKPALPRRPGREIPCGCGVT